MFFESGVQLIVNCLIRLDPKFCFFTFLKKNLEKFDWGQVQRENGKKNVGFLLYFSCMKKAVTSKLLMRFS